MNKIMIIMAGIFLCGCLHTKDNLGVPTPKVSPKELSKDINKEIKVLRKESGNIQEQAMESKISAKEIAARSKVRESDTQERIAEILKEIDEYAGDIDDRQTEIIESTSRLGEATRGLTRVDIELMGVNQYLKDVGAVNKDLHNKNEELIKQFNVGQEKLDEYKSGVAAQNNKIWMGIVGFCAFMAAVGVAVALWVNPKIGIGITSAALILASIAYFMAKYAWIVAIVGGSLFLGAIIWGLWFFVIHKKALVESTISMETLKHKDWEDVKDNIKDLQSNSTSTLIRDLKYKNKIGK
jgi:hypothetical protein